MLRNSMAYARANGKIIDYDPKAEVAEDISMVVKPFFNNGMTEEQVAERMDVPVDYVKGCLES